MKIYIIYLKKKLNFYIYLDGSIFLIYKLKKYKKTAVNLSLANYNYLIVSKILRQYGLIKPLINKNLF
jgi:hypothetical protein